VRTETYSHLGYEIQISEHSPFWDAAIYPTEPGMAPVDWEKSPIKAANVIGALQEAKRRINEVCHPQSAA
jgi:hypothetical protein